MMRFVDIAKTSGWMPTFTSFAVKESNGTNVVLRQPDADPRRIDLLFSCHTDYCAGDGANDNASGMAVVLEIAEKMAGTQIGKRSAIAAFDMEERGLLGSKAIVQEMTKSKFVRPKLVINVDAVGASDLFVMNMRSRNSGLVNDLHASAREAQVALRSIDGDAIVISSDHLPFLKAGIPATTLTAFSSRAHTVLSSNADNDAKYRELMDNCSNCNKPADTLDALRPEGMVASVRLLSRLLLDRD